MRHKVATMAAMAAFAANPHENILFPVPYAENEEHPLIITNQRIIQRQRSPAASVELPTREVHFVGRQVVRPRLAAGMMLLAMALPLLGFGAYQLYTMWGYTMARPLSLFGVADDDAPATLPLEVPPEGTEAGVDWPRQVLMTRLVGAACVLAALGCAIGARRLIKKKRFYVLCRGGKRLLKIEAKDEIQQTQIMVTVAAVKGKSLQ